jgi:hypothetical protein
MTQKTDINQNDDAELVNSQQGSDELSEQNSQGEDEVDEDNDG